MHIVPSLNTAVNRLNRASVTGAQPIPRLPFDRLAAIPVSSMFPSFTILPQLYGIDLGASLKADNQIGQIPPILESRPDKRRKMGVFVAMVCEVKWKTQYRASPMRTRS